MEHDLDSSQARAVLDFMLFLNDTLSRTSQHFEDETLCSPEEANVISLLSRRGPLMVKEIAQAMPGMDPSKLTRVLDSLEKQGYAIRTLNRGDPSQLERFCPVTGGVALSRWRFLCRRTTDIRKGL